MIFFSIPKQVFFFIVLSLFLGSCNLSKNVSFPEDGIYRYLILDRYLTQALQTQVVYLYLYNLPLDNNNALAELISFSQQYHCKMMNENNMNFIKRYFYILSDVEDFKLAPHYYDDTDWKTINEKRVYKIITIYDSLSNTIDASIFKGINEDGIISSGNIKECNDVGSSTFIQLKGRSWRDVYRQSDNAWKKYEVDTN